MIADQMLAELKVFDERGAWRATLGQRGDGPGEFSWPRAVAPLPDGTLAVLDRSHARVTRLDASGEWLEDWRLAAGRYSSLAMGTDGRLIVGGYLLGDLTGSGQPTVHILDESGVVIESIHARQDEWRRLERNFSQVFVAVSGSLLLSVESSGTRAHFTDLVSGESWAAELAPDYYPAIDWPGEPVGGLDSATAWYNRQVWVHCVIALPRERFAVGFTGQAEQGERWWEYLVIDRLGGVLAHARPDPASVMQYGSGADILGYWTDAEGLVWLRRYSLQLQ